MPTFIDQVFLILTTPPGNLVYHLVLAFTIAATFQISLSLARREDFPQGRRLLTGLALLLVARLLLFLAATWAWQSGSPLPDVPFAILDRAITAISVLIIVWLWAFPEPSRTADNAFIALGILPIIFFILSMVWWSNNGQLSPFNSSAADILWQTFTIFLIFIGGNLLIIRSPVGWGTGLVLLIIMFVGHLVHLASPMPDADYPGIIRLAQMTAYPLLFFLPQRFHLLFPERQVINPPLPNGQITTLPDDRFTRSIRELATQDEPSKFFPALAHTIAYLSSSDACFLVATNPTENHITLEFGYDLIREVEVPKTNLEFSNTPLIVNAINQGEPLILPADNTSIDQVSLGHALNLSTSGPLLVLPLFDSPTEIHRGIVLLSPYSHREWDEKDQNFLKNLLDSFAPALDRAHQFEVFEEQVSNATRSVQNAEGQLREISRLNQKLTANLNDLEEKLSQEQSRAESLAALIAAKNYEEDITDPLSDPKFNLSPSHEHQAEMTDNGYQSIQEDLRLAQDEILRLKSSLAIAQQRIQTLEESSSEAAQVSRQARAIANITKEIQLPLSSITGYTEVLLSNSSDSIDASHKKLLERIKASAQRLTSLLEELAQLTGLPDQRSDTQPLSLLALIEESIALTHQGIRRKKLSLKTSIPEKLPQVLADRQVLRQLIMRLFQKAITASPQNGSIMLSVRYNEVDVPPDTILLEISDSSPGIPPVELSQVFSSSEHPAESNQVHRSTLPLSTLKRRFEAQGGRIWVDSVLEQGTTFSLLLPIHQLSHSTFSHFPESDEALG